MVAPTIKVEVAFDSNFTTPDVDRTWTDISAYVLLGPGVAIIWGRSDSLSQTEPATLSLTLDNSDGRFSAGNSSSPYYPNVKLDRPIRVTVTPSGGSDSVRFTGYVDAWPVQWPAVVTSIAMTPITATSRTGRLGLRNALRAMIVEQAMLSSAAAIYPLDDPSGSTTAEDVSGNDAAPLAVAGISDDVSFGGSGVEIVAGGYLAGSASALILADDPEFTFAVTFTTTTANSTQRIWGACYLTAAQLAPYTDGRPHRLAVARASGGTVTAKIDNVTISGYTIPGDAVPFIVGLNYTGTARDACYWTTAFVSGDFDDDYAAFNGGFGETSDASLERIATYAGIPSAEVDADAGSVVMGGIDTTGMAVVDALHVIESTEGGTLIDARNGDLRLIGRRARYGSSVDVTFSMTDVEIAPGYAPVLDRVLLRNDMTGTNAASSIGSVDAGSTISKRAFDQASIDEYGAAGSSVEVAAADESEAFAAAAWIVANRAEPASRAPDVTANLLTMDAARQAEVLALFSGSRIALTSRASQDASASAEFFVEGGSEVYSASAAALSWNLSPVGLEDSIVIIDNAVKGQIDAGNFIGY